MKFILVAALLLCTSSCWAQTSAAASPSRHAETAEDRIATLHSDLKITPAQEDKWGKVADAMRNNAKTVDDLIQQRHDNAGKDTAVENLRSWTQIAQAHADGSKAVLNAFEALYANMSDAQKKAADELFRPAQSQAK